MNRLKGKVCVVTGATGMAAAAARRFAEEGADVFVVAKDEDECAALAFPYALADLRQEAQAELAFTAARAHRGRINSLFAVAGASGRRIGDGAVHEMSQAAWDGTMALNATPAFLAAREAVRVMMAQEPNDVGSRGSIVLMASVLAEHPEPARFATHAYASSKAAIIGLARSMAAYYATHGIRVNAVAPGLVTTPMSARAAADPQSVAFAEQAQVLAGGFLKAGEIADAAVYLCADESRAVTGQLLAVDGGWSVRGATR